MPTPIEQRIYHRKLDRKGGIARIDDGDVLVETVAPWQTWIGETGSEVPSTYFDPPTRLLVPDAMAGHLVGGGAAVVIEEPHRKPGRPSKTKAMEPEEDK